MVFTSEKLCDACYDDDIHTVRDNIIKKNVSGDSEYALHHEDTCVCQNEEIGKERRELAKVV